MEELRSHQDELLRQLKSALTNFKKTPKVRLSKTYVEVKIKMLEGLWDSFTQNHMGLIMSTTYMSDDVYSEGEDAYTLAKCEMVECLERLTPTVSLPASTSEPLSTSEKRHTEIKLPRITIPTFSGNYAEWTSFHDLFVSLIHKNHSLTNVQRLHYLKSSLSGEAEALLRHISTTEANYDEAWSTLKKRFSNKRFVVNALLKRMLNQKPVTTESSHSVKSILDTTNECLSALKNLGIASFDWDPMLVHVTVNKLDAESVRLWEQHIGTNEDCSEELPTYKQLCVFLESRFRTLEVLESTKQSRPRSNTRQSSFHAAASMNSNCNFCKGRHLIYHCKDFTTLNYDERKNFIERNGLCYNCLIPNHTVLTCKHKTSCRRCGKRHHSLIHPENKTTDQVSERAETFQFRNDPPKVAFTPVNTNVASHYAEKELPTNVLLATAMVKVILQNGATHHLRALIDQGSQGSFITESATQLLGLNKIPINCTINGLGENGRSLHSKSMVSFQAHSIVDKNFATPVKACVLKSLTRMLPTTEVHTKDWSHLRQLELADPHYAKPGKVDLLLGADVYSDIITAGLKKGPRGSPIAQNTHLGWILTGQISSTEALHGYATTLSMHICTEDKMLQRFWEIEEGACKKHLTGEEEGCEQHFKETHTRQEDGRYAVALPFKNPDPLCQYGESRDVAKARWLQMERRLEKDPRLKKEYNDVMNEYLDLQHMQELIREEDKYKPTAVYLPHHAVIRADRTTTKVRVVFDASCKYKNQVSLNDDLMVGPRLQQDLRHIIMRWRQHKVVLVADIVKMYRQVIVTQPDFQRVLWRENTKDQIRDFQMNRVTFGTASAPYLATKVLQQLAIDEKEQHPTAATIALTDFYVDDLLTGANSYEEGISIYNDMTALLKSGGFELQKWNTNDPNLLRIMHGVDNHDKELNLDMTVKTLGIAWNNMRDEFQYSINLPEQPVVTKRTIASDVSKLFDPMGWLAPTIILGKVFLQKLWLSGVTWDQEIPETLKEDWLKYRSELPGLSEIKIERWLNTTTSTKLELHGFSDASIMAYAAVVYSRVISPAGDIHVQLISGKTKVAPIRTVSVPRLELCGAVLLAKLLNEVAEHLKVPKENIYAYTDSQVVLAWLQGHPSKWKTFIANRTSEILTTLPAHHWSHVASKENPSDLASRGVSGSMLKNETLWWKGPKWLLEGENKHKVPTDLPEDLQLEERVVHFIDTTNTNSETNFTQELFERFSTLEKLLRVIARCKRFGKKERYPTYLTAAELSLSLTVCVLLCQREEFADDVHYLRANKPLKKRSKLRLLNPFLDEMAVLRVGGRLRHANIPEDAKHQIILPYNHILSKLIIAQAHMKTLHGGPTLMLNYIRQKFWILGCKNMINKEVHRCVVCVRYRAATRTQLMADLPQQRVTPTRPFLHAGVDFAGPIDLRMSKGRGCKTYKGYICIFICMASKAIHIEIVSSLDSESFVAAFKRFTARRGHCSHIWSDNATNFTAGNKQLRDLFENHLETVKNQIYDQLARDNTTWHHIPANSPHFGGLWEAGVRSIKHHLRRILGNSTLTYEEMSTVTSQIEACLNSRPISPISNDVNDLLPLTPGHFLIGEPPIVVPEPSHLDTNINRLNRWQLTQRLFQHFWSRWSTEYLGRLQQRPKWVKQMDNDIKIGTLVLVKDDNLPPGKWPLARIIDLHPGDDGLIRVVSLKCKNTVVKRSITKICLLPVDS